MCVWLGCSKPLKLPRVILGVARSESSLPSERILPPPATCRRERWRRYEPRCSRRCGWHHCRSKQQCAAAAAAAQGRQAQLQRQEVVQQARGQQRAVRGRRRHQQRQPMGPCHSWRRVPRQPCSTCGSERQQSRPSKVGCGRGPQPGSRVRAGQSRGVSGRESMERIAAPCRASQPPRLGCSQQ